MSERSFRSERSKGTKKDKEFRSGSVKEWEEHEYNNDATVAGPSSPALTRNVTGASGATWLTEQETGVAAQSRVDPPEKPVWREV